MPWSRNRLGRLSILLRSSPPTFRVTRSMLCSFLFELHLLPFPDWEKVSCFIMKWDRQAPSAVLEPLILSLLSTLNTLGSVNICSNHDHFPIAQLFLPKSFGLSGCDFTLPLFNPVISGEVQRLKSPNTECMWDQYIEKDRPTIPQPDLTYQVLSRHTRSPPSLQQLARRDFGSPLLRTWNRCQTTSFVLIQMLLASVPIRR